MASQPDSTDGATSQKEEAAQARAEVGGVRSSDDDVLDLWWSGQNTEERRDATCSAEVKSREGLGDGPRGLPAPDKVRQLQITLYRKAKSKPAYRFWSLYGEVQRADVLLAAWRRVKANAGEAGADRVTIGQIASDPERGSRMASRTTRGAADEELPPCAGAASGDREEDRRDAPVGHSDGERPGGADGGVSGVDALELNETKTRVIQSHDSGFHFLGFNLRWQQSKKGTPYVHVEPSPAAEQSVRDKLYELTRRSTTWKAAGGVVREINEVTRGWGNYFALAHYHRSFKQMNRFIAQRLRQWLWRKHGNPSGKYQRWPDQTLFAKYGLYNLPTRPNWNCPPINGARKAGCGKTACPV